MQTEKHLLWVDDTMDLAAAPTANAAAGFLAISPAHTMAALLLSTRSAMDNA